MTDAEFIRKMRDDFYGYSTKAHFELTRIAQRLEADVKMITCQNSKGVAVSELTDRLTKAGKQHKGTDLGGLLQWAVLHIADQDGALEEIREEYAAEAKARLKLEQAICDAKVSIEATLSIVSAPLCKPTEIMRDLVPHINLMAAHGDPDYLKGNGMSIRHVDCRETKARRKST